MPSGNKNQNGQKKKNGRDVAIRLFLPVPSQD